MNPKTTVAFTGYRTAKILKSAPNNQQILWEIADKLDQVIEELYIQGYRTFLSGMAIGFDIMAAEATLRAKRNHPDIEFVAVVPFENQELMYDLSDRVRYTLLIASADQIVCIDKHFSNAAYFKRNDFLVDNAAAIVCYHNGQNGGTAYAVARAVAQKKPVKNLFGDIHQPIK